MMTALLFITSLFSIIGVSVLAYGYRASLFSEDPATRWFARSMVLLSISFFWRRLVWDIAVPTLTGVHAENPSVNIVLNMIAIASVYAGLKARWLLIPDCDRADWRWYTSWAHPSIFQIRPDTQCQD